jgi:hypothetical protein
MQPMGGVGYFCLGTEPGKALPHGNFPPALPLSILKKRIYAIATLQGCDKESPFPL